LHRATGPTPPPQPGAAERTEIQAICCTCCKAAAISLTSTSPRCAVRFLVCDVLARSSDACRSRWDANPPRLPECCPVPKSLRAGRPMSMKARTFLMTAYASGPARERAVSPARSTFDSALTGCASGDPGQGQPGSYGLLRCRLLEQLPAARRVRHSPRSRTLGCKSALRIGLRVERPPWRLAAISASLSFRHVLAHVLWAKAVVAAIDLRHSQRGCARVWRRQACPWRVRRTLPSSLQRSGGLFGNQAEQVWHDADLPLTASSCGWAGGGCWRRCWWGW